MTRTGNFHKVALLLATTASSLAYTSPASAQATEMYLGQMMQVGFNFCPRGWASASGQILAISTNTALFSLLGTTYGGNGQTTFALPDMRGRMAINQGSGPGLSPYLLGEQTGTETTTLLTTQIPSHTHRSAVQTAVPQANATTASGNAFGISSNSSFLGGSDPVGNLMSPGTVQFQPTGNNIPIPVRPPYLTVQWCIATQGIFPARN
ncbi:tail fiber protein [Sphingopyxis sp. OPL5]|nr:tail fiber protein [Sphingopyxis sp. OPL5]